MNCKYLLCFAPIPFIGALLFSNQLNQDSKSETFDPVFSDPYFLIVCTCYHGLLSGVAVGALTFWLIK